MATNAIIQNLSLLIGIANFFYQLLSACSINPCEKMAIRSSTSACVQKASLIEEMLTLETSSARNAGLCISRCYLNALCSMAIYQGPPGGECSLMSTLDGDDVSVPFPLNQTGCIAMTVDNLRCQNCGTPKVYSCECPLGFSGLFCEMTRPPYCGVNEHYEPMDTLHFKHTQTSQMPVKVKVTGKDNSYTNYRIDEVQWIANGKFQLLSQPSLSMDHAQEIFATPVTMEFRSFRASTSMTTVNLLLNGSVYTYPVPEQFVFLTALITYTRKGKYVSYDGIDQTGNPRDIIEGLVKGHRLLSRTPVTVSFEPDSNRTAFVLKASNQANHSETDFILPLELSAVAYTLHTGKKHQVVYGFGQGYQNTIVTNTAKIWELDECWYQVESVDETKTVGMLTEAVLRGQEVRVQLETDDFIAADTTHVTLAKNDVVVALAPYTIPKVTSETFELDQSIVRSAISVTKTMALCTGEIGNSESSILENGLFPGKITWLLSHYIWQKKLKLDGDGKVIEGKVNPTYSALAGGREGRVCVEFLDGETLCSTYSKVVAKVRPHSSVLFQTRSFIKPSFDADGRFQGYLDPPCQLTEYLISTDGWIRGVSYVIGNPEVRFDNNITFNSMTWFVKKYM